MATRTTPAGRPGRTDLFYLSATGERHVGFVAADDTIYRLRWGEGLAVGRVDASGRVFRMTRHDERELGTFTPDGIVVSHGLFEGGQVGWVEPDGVVVQEGLIFGEEEIGRVEGPQPAAGAAALLLLFLPDELEANKRMGRE